MCARQSMRSLFGPCNCKISFVWGILLSFYQVQSVAMKGPTIASDPLKPFAEYLTEALRLFPLVATPLLSLSLSAPGGYIRVESRRDHTSDYPSGVLRSDQ